MVVDALVVGAGVVGLAISARLAADGRSVLVVERRGGPGRETSSRNSGVIHAGIYYPRGSLRARHCVAGNELLYRFCEENGVEVARLGKLVVATTAEEIPALEELLRRGRDNGARDLQLLDRPQIRALEPNIIACGGILSPSTGIVDSHALIKALEAETAAEGGIIRYRCEVIEITDGSPGFQSVVEHPAGTEQLGSRVLVNAAGLESDRVSRMAGVDRYLLHWCKGQYFAVSGNAARMVSRLVYPIPGSELVGLGVHATLDLAGRMRLGPDAAYVDRGSDDLDVDPASAGRFYRAARKFLPGLAPGDLHPDMAGIRPKNQGPGDTWRDFVIQEESSLGRPGLINLIGIDSPGLTASLSIAREVADLAQGCF